MPSFTMHTPGPYGEKQLKEWSYSQVAEVNGRIGLSGQGGYHPETLDFPRGVTLEEEIERAFNNVTFMLKSVGLDWSHVVNVDTFHVPESDGYIVASTTEVAKQFAKRMPGYKPTWTALGVAVLGDPGMRVEVRVTAYRP